MAALVSAAGFGTVHGGVFLQRGSRSSTAGQKNSIRIYNEHDSVGSLSL